MKRWGVLIGTGVLLAIELIAVVFLGDGDRLQIQDTVAVNEILRSVEADWGDMGNHRSIGGAAYVVTDLKGNVLFATREGLSESVNAGIAHRDTLLDIYAEGEPAGKLIIWNEGAEALQAGKQRAAAVFAIGILLQGCVCGGYMFYLQRKVIRPFRGMKEFAERVAGGNLDVPLKMDRENIFGAFTESFDIMRSELKRARLAEAEAKAEKKELVAKLSHDIKTPVASIRAASEVGLALSETCRQQEIYSSIIAKADQINALITNLFSAALEELSRLSVTPSDMDSRELRNMLENADYLHRAEIPEVPGCLVYADQLRLQQVFDNIFANSYKYANTGMKVSFLKDARSLSISIEDEGGGVKNEELPLIKEKFKRGSGAGNVEGAGLGLYLADFFLKEMQGELNVENGRLGLTVTVKICLSGFKKSVRNP